MEIRGAVFSWGWALPDGQAVLHQLYPELKKVFVMLPRDGSTRAYVMVDAKARGSRRSPDVGWARSPGHIARQTRDFDGCRARKVSAIGDL